MKRRWIWLLLPGLVALALAQAVRLGRAAESPLQVAFEPTTGAAGTTFNVVLKNFSWDDMVLVQAAFESSLVELEQNITEEEAAVGPRRRAALPFTPEEPGGWRVAVEGSWLSGGSVFTETTLLVATPGSTTGEITLGQSVSGVVKPYDHPDSGNSGFGVWTFHGQAGQEITLELTADTPLADSESYVIGIIDSRGEQLALDAGLIPDFSLPRDGRYYAVVVAQDAELAYTLTLSEGMSGDDEGGALPLDSAVNGLIEPNTDEDAWTLTAAAGDVVVVTLRAPENSNLDGYLRLEDAGGNVLSSSDDASGRVAQMTYVFPAAGDYRLVAQSSGGNSSGAYRLIVERGEALNLNFFLTPGDSRVGNVPLNGAEIWQFQGEAGDQITIVVQRTDDSLDPYMVLYGPGGGEIANDDDGGGGLNPLLETTLPETGLYTIAISSYGGTSSGAYTIELEN